MERNATTDRSAPATERTGGRLRDVLNDRSGARAAESRSLGEVVPERPRRERTASESDAEVEVDPRPATETVERAVVGGDDPTEIRRVAADVDAEVVGRVLRRTHLDEIPQLWAILLGDMSVVGPQPERPELDPEFDREARGWRRRWFVKPGLTGLAQIRGVTSHRPSTKLRHDLEYVRRQSLSLDVRIVLRQLGGALASAVGLFRGR